MRLVPSNISRITKWVGRLSWTVFWIFGPFLLIGYLDFSILFKTEGLFVSKHQWHQIKMACTNIQNSCLVSLYKIVFKGLTVEILQILFLKTTCSCVYFSEYVCCHAAKWFTGLFSKNYKFGTFLSIWFISVHKRRKKCT